MRSVPGAHFRFDWCVSAAVRPIALSSFYPGDDVVDIVGIDAYDTGVAAGVDPLRRWSIVYGRPAGIGELLAFARAHGKPLSIPEWGVTPPGVDRGGGDDPTYVDGIASLVRSNEVAYQAYFFRFGWAAQLAGGPLSWPLTGVTSAAPMARSWQRAPRRARPPRNAPAPTASRPAAGRRACSAAGVCARPRAAGRLPPRRGCGSARATAAGSTSRACSAAPW